MILCGEGCTPCCDFCIYEISETWQEDGKIINGGPIGCSLHRDEKHQQIAQLCGECDDFHCYRAENSTDKDVQGRLEYIE